MPRDLEQCPVCGYVWGTTYAGILECQIQTAMHPDDARARADTYRRRGCLLMRPPNDGTKQSKP